jgi:mycothiol system anti-sigma-R factor
MNNCDLKDATDCSATLERLFLFIVNEMGQADSTEIRRHLDDCSPCLAKYDLDCLVKALVARSCSEHAPEPLRQKVMLSIRRVQLEIQRGPQAT